MLSKDRQLFCYIASLLYGFIIVWFHCFIVRILQSKI